MQNQFSRAHQFLAGLAVKSEPALHDAFVAEVLETAGALVIPDDKSSDFYEITLHGGWMPQTTPYEPQTKTSGGHTREADMGRIGRRIRAIQPIAAEHIGLGLDDLQAIYGHKNKDELIDAAE
jgi:hypothetical protein